ncbi:MAG: aspartate--ammonia ligase [Bacteroidia bacterium]|nr:aspartate--ammonia ligase [Bacteroidia bacterium]NNF30232.1 aspartate--ammonia ligase [Flavobacteriaceae bacterium]MBT8274507.1 aspartate--ammonia ligase [Bacteroidia bacterium]NNJ83093.1 aspartate--ammonia ligase [Flavobacteriaceae bacterium]NNK54683.1 aspartate--ammonia ligase [Flavobacteriaceae bacterium]
MDVKQKDLAGPGISTYEEVSKILPENYSPLLPPLKRMEALYLVKEYIEKGLAEALNIQMVQVPLIVSKDSGVNDYLDRDGSRTPVEFPAGLGLPKRIEAQIVQAATKWKRMALAQFGCEVGQGINTDMRAVRKDYFLDHDHSAYVDQWDWEKRISENDRNLEYLKDTVREIWNVIRGAGIMVKEKFPELNDPRYPDFPEELKFFHAEEILDMYPDLPRKERETKLIQEHHAVFIIGIGSVLKDGYPHEMRAADYDDWITPTVMKNGEQYYGLNGDILVWNPVTQRRHELSSMGIRVTKETMIAQLELSGQTAFLELPYHKAILNDEIPLSIGGGIGQARTYMYLLRTAHLGEVTVSIWPDELKRICKEKNIEVLE